MQPFKYSLKNQGFALLEILLAVVVLSIITFASYQMINSYKDSKSVQTAESDIMNIAQAFSPMLNQSGMLCTQCANPFSGTQMSTSILRSVPIPAQRLTDPDPSAGHYSYVLASFTVNGHQAKIGFGILRSATSPTSPSYFVAGFKANYTQAVQIIQDMNNTMGIFVDNTGSKGLKDSKNVTIIPSCPTASSKSCTFNIYLVSPMETDLTAFDLSTDFVAPTT